MNRTWSWALMAVVVAASVAVGMTGDRGPRTEDDRVNAIATQVRCPTCRSLSAAESDAKAAQAVRDEIRSRLRRGETDEQIRGYLVSRYGPDILLEPQARGISGLVWVLPAVAGVAAVASLGVVFRRSRQPSGRAPDPDERALVEEALQA